MNRPYFNRNEIVLDTYWRMPVGILRQWYDDTSAYKHGWYYDVEVADGENVGLKYTAHEEAFAPGKSLEENNKPEGEK